jgi:DNA-binding transcriptional LysR family regulator
MELRHLKYFVAVAEELNFRRAAQRLNVSQPPLTIQIRQLEQIVGAQLFDRNKQRVILTPAGREMLQAARRIFDEIAAAKLRAAHAAAGTAGELRVGYTESAIHVGLVSETLRELRSGHPDIVLTLCPMKSILQLAAIERGELDVGFVWAVPDMRSAALEIEQVWEERLVVALPTHNPLAEAGREVAMAELAAERFVTVSRDGGTLMFRTLTALCRTAGFTPEIAYEAPDLAASLGLVSSGAGVAIVPTAMTSFRPHGVTYAGITDPAARVYLQWVSRAGASLPLAELMRRTMQHLAARSAPGA